MTSVDDDNNGKPDECGEETAGPAPTQDEVGAGWSSRRRRFVVFWLVFLWLGVVITIVVVVVKFGFKPNPIIAGSTATPETNPDDPVMTSSTATPEINTEDFVTASSTATPEIDNSEIPVVPSIWKQQGEANVGDRGFASSMALSADASIVAIGYESYNPVQIFRADDDGEYIVQIGQDIFADALDISAEGKTIICGSRGDNYDGYVRVFSLESDNVLGTDSTWKQIGQDIIGTLTGGEFGRIVSISKDGKTIAASSGAIYNYSTGLYDSGPVRIYRLAEDGTSWEQIGEDIVESYDDIYSAYVSSLSLSADGSTIAIGENDSDTNGNDSGQVTVYRFDSGGGNWNQLGQRIHGDSTSDKFGSYVQLSNDGNVLTAGTLPYYSGSAYVRVYSIASSDVNIDNNTWKQIGQDFSGETDCDNVGWPVSLSDDGKTLAISRPSALGENVYESVQAGLVTIYRMDDSNSGWMQLGDPIKGEEANEYSGCSVLLSADGNKVVIGYTKEEEYHLYDYVRTYVLE